MLLLGLSLAACSASPAPAPAAAVTREMSLSEKAAAQATEMIAQAEATALIRRAQAEATALVEQAGIQPTSDWPGTVATLPPPGEAQENPGSMVQTQPAENLAAFQDRDAYKVEIINVVFGAEGGFIVVNFRASQKAVNDFWPGRMSVTDEASGTVYNEVATMPIVGPLIGRPLVPGQPGYVMFVNPPPGLPAGSLITVQLGQFTQEHVRVGE